MNIANVAQASTPTSFSAKTEGTAKVVSTVTSGNSLPDAIVNAVSSRTSEASITSPQPNSAELNVLVSQANETLQGRFSDLKFTVAEGTDIKVVRIEDKETGELIRQVPSEAMVAIARALEDAQRGMMLTEKV